MTRNLDHRRTIRPLALALTVMVIGGCGSGAASLGADGGSASTVGRPAAPEPVAAASTRPSEATPSESEAPATTTTSSAATQAGETAAAAQSALKLFEEVSGNPQDASAGGVWVAAKTAAAHLSPAVNARLATLRGSGYFGDQVCAEEYLTGTQNGLSAAPRILSARRGADGTVTVVIRRPATPAPPNLSLVMTDRTGAWLAIDLASGSGPSASIFATKPHC